MPSREPRTVRVDPDVWSMFTSKVEKWEDGKHGELGRHVENALEEYIDKGRMARVEEKLDEALSHLREENDAHTHMDSVNSKVSMIARKIGKLDRTVIPKDEVVRSIEEVAGVDDRTINKYKRQLKRQGLAYSHPTSGVWTLDKETWFGWSLNHIDNNPTMEIHDVIEEYPIDYSEFERQATEIEA